MNDPYASVFKPYMELSRKPHKRGALLHTTPASQLKVAIRKTNPTNSPTAHPLSTIRHPPLYLPNTVPTIRLPNHPSHARNLTQRIHPHLNYPSPRAQHQPYDRCTPSLPLPSLQNLRPPPYLPRHSAHDISVGLTLPRYGSEVGRAGGRTIGPSLLGGSPQYQSGTRRRRRATGWRPTQPDGVEPRWALGVGGRVGRKGGGSG